MNTIQRIAKNTALLMIAQVASYLLSFFSVMYIARYLGAAGFGILSFALAFTGIFAVFGDLGLSPLTVREVARDKSLAPKYLANVALMKIILVVVTFGLISLTINLMGYPPETIRVVYLLALSVILAAFTQMFYSIFQAFERMEFQAVGQMLSAALILGGAIFAITHGFTVIGFASLYVIASAIALAYSFAVMKLKFSNPASASAAKAMEFDWSFWKPTIRQALPFGLTSMFVVSYYYADTLMLSLMQGNVAVGLYNAAYRIALALMFIPAAFNTTIFPIMSGLYKNSQSSFNLSFERYFKYMVILGVPIGIGITLLGPRFVSLVFGAEYAEAAGALQILIWSIVATFVGTPFATLFSTANRQVIVTKVAIWCTVLNIILNIILIPRYSLIGASIATVVATSAYLVPFYILSIKIGYGIPMKRIASILIKVMIAGGLMAIFVAYFHDLILLVLVPSAAAVYISVLLVLKGIDGQDRDFVRRLLR
jgi:O-antigen/teichoic acid export membrane protein